MNCKSWGNDVLSHTYTIKLDSYDVRPKKKPNIVIWKKLSTFYNRLLSYRDILVNIKRYIVSLHIYHKKSLINICIAITDGNCR